MPGDSSEIIALWRAATNKGDGHGTPQGKEPPAESGERNPAQFDWNAQIMDRNPIYCVNAPLWWGD